MFMRYDNSEVKKEDMKCLLNILCIIQFFIMILLVIGNIYINNKTKEMRLTVNDIKKQYSTALAENNRLRQERTLIFQRAVMVNFRGDNK